MRSFTREVKDEILTGTHPRLFSRGLLLGMVDTGLVTLADGVPAIAVDGTRLARVAHGIVQQELQVDAEVLRHVTGHRARRFLLVLRAPGAREHLDRLMEQGLRHRRSAERRGYLAGVFLLAGSVTPPRSQYLLELRLGRAAAVQQSVRTLVRFGLRPRRRIHREANIVYLRGADEVCTALGLMDATEARLHVEESRVVRAVRGEVNRLVNAETANVEKSVQAGVRQAEWVRLLARVRGLDVLPPKLRAAAEARLAEPEATLEELGTRLGLTKAGVNHRLRRIVQLAQDAQGPGGAPGGVPR